MPILNQPPSLVKGQVNATGNVKAPEMRSAPVSTRDVPLQSFMVNIEGSILVARYWRQIKAQNDKLQPLDIGIDPQYQEYERIDKFETRQQGDWSFSVDPQTQEKTLTGETVIYPSIEPNAGDMMELDSGDGKPALFKVDSAEPITWRKQTCYRLNFSYYSAMTKEVVANLELKTTRKMIFIKSHVEHGKYPILAEEEYGTYRDLRRMFQTIESEYLRNFFTENVQTITVPNQGYVLYDPFLAKAILALLETSKHSLMRKMAVFSLENDYAFRMTSVWDSLLMVEPSHLHVCAWRMGAVDKDVLYTRPLQGGIYWSKLDRIMYPLDSRTDADVQFGINKRGAAYKLRRSSAPINDFERLVINKDLRDVEIVEEFPHDYETPDIHRVTIDECYVFSKAFYTMDYPKMSRLERMVWSFLHHEPIDVPALYELAEGSVMWDKLERLYYVPVLIILITVALRGPSSA